MHRALMVFEPPDGGVPDHVLHLTLGLREQGWEVEVAGPAEATIYPSLADADVPVHRLASIRRGFARPWSDASALVELVRIMRSERFDLVHCHSSKAGALGRIAATLAGVKAVYSPHCFGFVGDVTIARRIFAIALERSLGRVTAALVCVCDAELRIAERRRIARPERRRRIYNAVEPCDRDGPVDPSLAELRRRGPVVGTVSVLRRQKGIDVLLRAAPAILDRNGEASVVIVGDGPERASLERLAGELGLTDEPRFRFLGFQAPSSRYLLGMDLFVLPSSWEAFPISLLEAMACGVPQVATDVGGNGEAISPESGVLIPPSDPESLSDAVAELLEDPDRRHAMARSSVERAERRFSRQRMTAEFTRLYDSVLRGSAPA